MMNNDLKEVYKKINDYLNKNNYDVMVITSYENCFYLSGVFLYYNAIIIPKNDKPILLVKYIDRQIARNMSFIEDIRGYSPYPIENQGEIYIGEYGESISKIIKELDYENGNICMSDYWAVLRPFIKISEYLPNAKVSLGEPFLEQLRVTKLPHEITKIQKSLSILDNALNSCIPMIKEGVTESEIIGEIAKNIWSNSGELWHAIIASGPNSLLPHSKIDSNRKLKKGENVVIDLVCCYDNYYSGLTRTFVVEESTKEQEEIYSILREAADLVYKTVRPGMEVGQIARIALDYFESKGYAKNIRHAFGHAIGTFPHESPILNTSDKTILKENMVFCFEPGIYVEDLGGFRLGDLVIMTANGLNKFTDNNRLLINKHNS